MSAEVAETRRHRRRTEPAKPRLIRDFCPPEGVPLNFEVAGLGMRFAAQITDLLLTGAFVIALMVLLSLSDLLPWTVISTIGSLLFFLIRAPYYVLAELIWNGQTLGKRICRLRVVSADGRSLRPYAVTVRNLLKELEVFVPGTYLVAAPYLGPGEYILLLVWIAILLAVPLFNRKRQRLGDMIANTYVIHQPQTLLMPDLSTRVAEATRERFTFLAHQLDHYGAFELQTLERVLHVKTKGLNREVLSRHAENLVAIADKIRTKIEYLEPVADEDVPEFLEAFYVAQRRYLESRKLFGDARADKFHGDDAEASKGGT